MGGDYDIFLHDRQTDETVLVSHLEGAPSHARPMPSKAYWLSPDGSRALYATFREQNPGAFAFFEELTLYDKHTRTASVVAKGAGVSTFEVRSSTDGTIVVFAGIPSFEGPPPFMDSNGNADLYLYDQQSDSLSLISAAAGAPTTTGNRRSPHLAPVWTPTVSRSFDMDAAGNWVIFGSDASNLIPSDTNGTVTDIFLYEKANQTISLVSRSTGGGTANSHSRLPSISSDGQRLVFQSAASDLVPGLVDRNGSGTDIYLYEPVTDTMVLVSRTYTASNETGDGGSFDPVISKDGSTIVFASTASDLVSGFVDGNGSAADIYRYDVATGSISLASRSHTGASQGANGASQRPRVDAQAERILFESQASDLVPGFVDGNGPAEPDLFTYRAAATVTLVTRAAGSIATSANQGFDEPLLSSTGGTALYASAATDLVAPMATVLEMQAYAFDIATASTTVAVTAASLYADASSTGDQDSTGGDIDGVGRFVVFSSHANNLVIDQIDSTGDTESLFLYDRDTGERTLVSRAAGTKTTEVAAERPRISSDGSGVAFVSGSAGLVAGLVDDNDADDVYHFDRQSGVVRLVSHAVGAPTTTANAGSSELRSHPSVSGDGRFVAFLSEATDLTTGFVDHNTGDDLFLFDRTDSSNTLVSASSTAPLESANLPTAVAEITPTGRYVVFETPATDVVSGFINPLPSTATPAANLVLWDRQRRPLAPGASAPPLDITVRAPGVGGTIINTATASAAVPEAMPVTNTDFETTTIIGNDQIFTDGFEAGDTSAWSNTVPSSRQP